jgi:hypothetical protein
MAGLLTRIKNDPLKHFLILLTGPVIYSLAVPIAIADICGTLYQWICFPVYQIPPVKRRDHIVIDRAKLAYLNPYHKLNCLYCEYANGVIAYVGEIVARTEWFWCPIKHAREIKSPHAHYEKFLEYGDGENFRGKLKAIRKGCRACEKEC